MLKDSILKIFERDLQKLRNEIEYFADEKNLWLAPGLINNSPGNLCLHLCGNLKHFIGAVIGESGYIRQRDKEFSLRNVPKEDLLRNINETSDVVLNTIKKLNEKDFDKIYPVKVFDEEMTTGFFIIHLTTHLNYHLGQINYLRRVIQE